MNTLAIALLLLFQASGTKAQTPNQTNPAGKIGKEEYFIQSPSADDAAPKNAHDWAVHSRQGEVATNRKPPPKGRGFSVAAGMAKRAFRKSLQWTWVQLPQLSACPYRSG